MIEYILNNPIEFEGEMISKIQMEEPKLKHFKKIEKLGLTGDFSSSSKLLEILTGKNEVFVDDLSMLDVEGLQELLKPYLKKSHQISSNA